MGTEEVFIRVPDYDPASSVDSREVDAVLRQDGWIIIRVGLSQFTLEPGKSITRRVHGGPVVTYANEAGRLVRSYTDQDGGQIAERIL